MEKKKVALIVKVTCDVQNSKSYQLSYRNFRIQINENRHQRYLSEENASRALAINGDYKDDSLMNIPAKTCMNLFFQCGFQIDDNTFNALKETRSSLSYYLCFDGYEKKMKKFRIPDDKIKTAFT